jgi:hypothetical protein
VGLIPAEFLGKVVVAIIDPELPLSMAATIKGGSFPTLAMMRKML